jgi:hypothetical protein
MTLLHLLDRLYWGVVILVPLAYAFLNFQAFKRTEKSYLLYLFLFDLLFFATATLSFLVRNAEFIHSNLFSVRVSLLVVNILRAPFVVLLYARLLKDLPSTQPN